MHLNVVHFCPFDGLDLPTCKVQLFLKPWSSFSWMSIIIAPMSYTGRCWTQIVQVRVCLNDCATSAQFLCMTWLRKVSFNIISLLAFQQNFIFYHKIVLQYISCSGVFDETRSSRSCWAYWSILLACVTRWDSVPHWSTSFPWTTSLICRSQQTKL